METTFQAIQRSDVKRKNAVKRDYRYLTYDECKVLSGHSLVTDRYGNIAQVLITSVKTWKTRAEIRIGYKYGLYEYGSITMVNANSTQDMFCIEVLPG